MKIRFVVTDASGAVLVSGEEPTDSAALSSWANHSSVVRLLRASTVRDRMGQRLVMWIEDDGGGRRRTRRATASPESDVSGSRRWTAR